MCNALLLANSTIAQTNNPVKNTNQDHLLNLNFLIIKNKKR